MIARKKYIGSVAVITAVCYLIFVGGFQVGGLRLRVSYLLIVYAAYTFLNHAARKASIWFALALFGLYNIEMSGHIIS